MIKTIKILLKSFCLIAVFSVLEKGIFSRKDIDSLKDSHPSDEAASFNISETDRDQSSSETTVQYDLTRHIQSIDGLAKSVGVQRRKSEVFDVFYKTDDDSLNAVAEKEHGSVEMLWFNSDKYSLYEIKLGMKREEAFKILENQSWNYSEILDVYEKWDYVIRFSYGSDEYGKTDRITEMYYGRYDYMFTDYSENISSPDTPIGNLTVNADGLRRRNGPSLSAESEEYTVNTGDCFEVYEITYGDGYLWYRIDETVWVASEGTYVTYHPY